MVVPGPGLQPSPEPLAGRRRWCGPGGRGSGEGRTRERAEARPARRDPQRPPRLRRKKTTLRQHGRAAVHAGRKADGKAGRRQEGARGPWSPTVKECPATRAGRTSTKRRLPPSEKAEAPSGRTVDGRTP